MLVKKNRGRLTRSFWAFSGEGEEGGAHNGGEKFDAITAIEKLRTDGFVVMKQLAFDNIIHENIVRLIPKRKVITPTTVPNLSN